MVDRLLAAMWSHRHLLGIEQLSAADVEIVLDRADGILTRWENDPSARKGASLKAKTVINLFFEASTRTRTSFEIAGKRLGADVVNVSASTSSTTKGETLLDTVRNLEAMHSDIVIVRHPSSGAPHFVAQRTNASVINAGDGTHEHPTQALLDALTIRRKKGNVRGLTVAICGDIFHSRVARSGAIALTKLGASVRFWGPRTMMPREPEAIANVTIARNPHEALEGADVIMMLRIQHERLAGAAMLSTTREYSRTFGLNAAALSRAKPDAIVMHPGPINRGVELDTILADGPQSVILDQVEAGVAVRAAVLELVS